MEDHSDTFTSQETPQPSPHFRRQLTWGQEGPSPADSMGNMTCAPHGILDSVLDSQPQELWDNRWQLFSATSPVALCYSSTRKLILTENSSGQLNAVKYIWTNIKRTWGKKQSIKLASPQNLERLWELLQQHDLRALTENRSVVVWYCDNLVNWYRVICN